MTATGLQPVIGNPVALLGSNEDWNAWTSTDGAGRFSLCGLPIDRPLPIYSDIYSEAGQSAWASTSVEPGGNDATIELILD
jgi:hypothetical protein